MEVTLPGSSPQPASQATSAPAQDVDELFPAQAKSVDELFPPEIDRDRYRRQTLGTSPVQDLIFGDTSVNPIARVLDAFGQGAKQGWGFEPAGLSKESEDFLKKAGIFNDYDAGQKSIIKAANESLFRGAAMYVVDPIMRGLPAGFAGAQAAIAQTGEELGQPKLGREAAGALEAFPTGLHAPTGIPHAPPHPMLAEIEKAKSLGVIGAGEEGWLGTADVTAPKPATEAAVVKPEVKGMPVDLFAEPRTEAPVAEKPAAPEPSVPEAPVEETAPTPIAQDVTAQLIAAGRPETEAKASAELISSHYQARSERFGGELGTPEELYAAEGPVIRGADGKPTFIEARPEPKPIEGGAAEQLPPLETTSDLKKVLRGRAAADPQTWSLYEFLASEGGLKPTPDLHSIFGNTRGPFIPGFGPLLRPNGLTMEEALTRAKENSYVLDPSDLAHTPHDATRPQAGELTKSVNDLQDMVAEESRGRKQYRNDVTQPAATVDLAEEAHNIIAELHQQVEATGGRVSDIDSAIEKRVVEMVQKEKEPDVMAAYERAIMEVEYNQQFNQIKRGKIRLREDARPIITLFKDANASTFIHETGHQWLEELMADSEHPKAPADLKADAIAVLDWLGVKTADQIKTSHHEKFARGFERYMMEGKAPNQALANVFVKFRDWLTRIYQTVTRLKSPINDEIRGVFDRLLTLHPTDVKIEPEAPAKTFADIHEADALNTPPEMAHPAAETIQGERDTVAARHVPEEQNARLKNTPEQARRSEAGNPQPDRNPDATGTFPGEAGNAEASGAISPSGAEVAPSRAPARTEPPSGPHDKFPEKAGNIRLDNLNTPEDLNQIIRQTAEENGDFQNVRGPVSDAQVLDLAEAAGVDAAFIDQRKLGEAWTAPQIVALRRLLIQSAQSVHDLAAKAAAGAEADVMAYAEAKARHQLIQERVSSVTAEAGRALRAFQSRFTEGMGAAQQVGDFLKDATGKTLFQLQQEAKFLSKLQTPQQTSKFITDTSKGTFRNAILEYYINALISGPVTHTRYMVSNALNALFTPVVEIPIAAAVGKVREISAGQPVERVHLGEAGAQLYGLIKGSRDGLGAAIEAFKTGVSPTLPTEKVSPHFAQANRAIPGKVGEVLNIPSKSVAAIHSFFKSLRYEQNIQALAYRTALTEGLKGDAFANRIAELTTNPSEAMMMDATSNALKELYMSPTDYHSSMGGLVRFTNNNLAAKIVVPFMKIGSQITRNAFIERTPLGLMDKRVRGALGGEQGGAAIDFQAGKIAAGVALMATSVGLMGEGMMTGDGPEDPAQRSVWLLSHTPASIQIGDINFKYGNTGPLGMLMRFAANTYETAHGMGDKDMATLAVSFFEGFAKSVLDETFLRGVKDALDAMFHPKEYGGRYIKSQLTNWIPWSVGLSQVARKIDPFQRETHGIFQAAQAKIPWLSEQLMPRRDMFGEPIPNGGPIPDYANDPVVRAMDAVHIGVGKIGKKIRGVDLTEQQYDDLARIAGRMAKTRLNAMVGVISNPNIPAAQRVEMIHSTISSSREAARSLVMMQSANTDNDIIRQANAAKIAKLAH